MNQIARILESDGLMEPLDMLLADVAIRVQLTATDHGKAEDCEFARNTDPLRADFAFKSDPSDGCVSILPHGPEWPGRILGDGIGGPDRQGSARIF